MSGTRRMAWAGACFVAGVLVGAWGVPALRRAWHPRTPQAIEDRMVRHLTRSLGLDERQREAVREIVHETGQQLAVIRADQRPKVEAVRAAADGRIRAALKPDQVERFEKLRKVWEARHHRHLENFPP